MGRITALSAHQRARRGRVRSFQITRLFPTFNVLDNVTRAIRRVSGQQPGRVAAGEREPG